MTINDAYLELAGPSAADNASRWDLGARTRIGRSAPCEVVVPATAVSRQHAEIERRTSGYWLADLGSRNGTFVDGVAVHEEPVRLVDGAEIVVAGAVTFQFVNTLATPMAPSIGRLHGLWIDPKTEAVWVDARRVEPPLSDRQMRLLRLLYDADGEIVDRRTVVDVVWSDVAFEGVSDEAVSALVKRLRARLADLESTIKHIEIVRNRGLRFVNT